jgi:hypothetical protein
MSQQITVSVATGQPPYNVYLCDTTLSYCVLISGSTLIPPDVVFTLPTIFQNTNSVVVKIIDIYSVDV